MKFILIFCLISTNIKDKFIDIIIKLTLLLGRNDHKKDVPFLTHFHPFHIRTFRNQLGGINTLLIVRILLYHPFFGTKLTRLSNHNLQSLMWHFGFHFNEFKLAETIKIFSKPMLLFPPKQSIR